MSAARQRNADGGKADIRAGRIPAGRKDKPAKLAQKDRDARWTVKFSKAKPSDDGSPRIEIAVPSFGYKDHIGIDRRHGLIRTWSATHAARHDGAQRPDLICRRTPRVRCGRTRPAARRRAAPSRSGLRSQVIAQSRRAPDGEDRCTSRQRPIEGPHSGRRFEPYCAHHHKTSGASWTPQGRPSTSAPAK